MQKKILLSLIILLGSGLVLGAQEDQETVFDKYPQALGAYISSMAGFEVPSGGIAYSSFWGDNGLQVWVGGGASSSTFSYSASAMYKRILLKSDFASWFSSALHFYLAGSHNGQGGERFNELGENLGFSYTPIGAVAVGFGFEAVLFEHFVIPFDLGYSVTFPDPFTIGLCVGGGFLYRF